MTADRIVIVGAGVIGLATAFRLAQRGASVTVLDADLPGQASRAAAGMLSPLAECREPGPLADLAVHGLRCFPAFLSDLNDVAGCQIVPFGAGMLNIALTPEESDGLKASLAWQSELGFGVEWLDSRIIHELEPALGEVVLGGTISPHEKHVDPVELLAQLHIACTRLGVVVEHDADAVGFGRSPERLSSVKTRRGDWPCSVCVVAAGAWSPALLQPLGVSLPIDPVRGQMIGLGPVAPPLFGHAIFRRNGYLVPRADGRIVLGGTEEHAGFSDRTSVEQIANLLWAAMKIVPALRSAPIERVWAGLRPVCADNRPVIGKLPNLTNAYLAGGHGRKGILLSAATADLMAAAILDGTALPEAFSPCRFQTAQ